MIRPPRLSPGARVAVVAPAGPVPPETFATGAAILAGRYQLVYDERIFARNGFLAGDDRARLAELARALDDPTLAAVFCARGGYGLLRIVADLDGAAFARSPKPIVGFSDVTVLHAWAVRAGVISLHAPVVTQLERLGEEDRSALFAQLESPDAPPPLRGLRSLSPGRARGRLVGGNLELISRLSGTPFLPSLDGAVLLLEEVGERPYRIDRALTQLMLAGALERLRAVILGDFVRCAEPDGAPPSAEAVIVERLAPLAIPIVGGAPIGHGDRNRAVAHGAEVLVDAIEGTVEFLEGAVS